MREVVATKQAPAVIGPYSQAIRANGFLFISGLIAIDPANGKVIDGGIADQTARVLTSVTEVLKAAGSSIEKVVKITVFLKDMEQFDAMNEVYERYFKTNPPARSTVQVARLPKDGLVEIEVIALA